MVGQQNLSWSFTHTRAITGAQLQLSRLGAVRCVELRRSPRSDAHTLREGRRHPGTTSRRPRWGVAASHCRCAPRHPRVHPLPLQLGLYLPLLSQAAPLGPSPVPFTAPAQRQPCHPPLRVTPPLAPCTQAGLPAWHSLVPRTSCLVPRASCLKPYPWRLVPHASCLGTCALRLSSHPPPPLPSQFVSSQAARRLAAAAFNRGLTLCPAGG